MHSIVKFSLLKKIRKKTPVMALSKNISNLVKFTLEKNPNFLVKNWQNFARKQNIGHKKKAPVTYVVTWHGDGRPCNVLPWTCISTLS
jgi:hypothetical protein